MAEILGFTRGGVLAVASADVCEVLFEDGVVWGHGTPRVHSGKRSYQERLDDVHLCRDKTALSVTKLSFSVPLLSE